MIARRVVAEFVGTALLVATVVGSGIMATNLSGDAGVQLLINALATVFCLFVLITLLAPISGAHFNPVVSLGEFYYAKLSRAHVMLYIAAQFAGGMLGVMAANVMFHKSAILRSHHARSGIHLLLGEVIATAGLLLIIGLLDRQRRGNLAALLVSLWIGAAYFFTSSTSFANPAVTFARAWSDTFSGIAIGSVLAFCIAQLMGGAAGLGIAHFLFKEPEISQ